MTDSARAVLMTGIGIVSPFGSTPEDLARRMLGASPVQTTSVDEIPTNAIPPERRTRLGRADRLTRFILAASYLAVQDSGLDPPFVRPERVGISFGTGLGCLITDAEYYARVIEKGPGGGSPQLFAYTVSSAAAGEVSIAMGIQGPNVTAHMVARSWLRRTLPKKRRSRRCLQPCVISGAAWTFSSTTPRSRATAL